MYQSFTLFLQPQSKGSCGRVARQRSAKPFTAVRIRSGPQEYLNRRKAVFLFGAEAGASSLADAAVANKKPGGRSPAVLIDTAGNVVATFPKKAIYIDDATPPAGIGGGDPEFEYPFYISETLRELVDEGKGIFTDALNYGLIDNKGNMILGFKYQRLSDLHGGKMFAHSSTNVNGSNHSDMGIIDDKGNWLVQIVAPQF